MNGKNYLLSTTFFSNRSYIFVNLPFDSKEVYLEYIAGDKFIRLFDLNPKIKRLKHVNDSNLEAILRTSQVKTGKQYNIYYLVKDYLNKNGFSNCIN